MSKMMMTALVAGALVSGQALAQTTLTCPDDGSTAVSLNAEARRNVTQDKIQAMLNIQAEGRTPAAVQEAVNRKMQAAKEVYGRYSSVKISTGGYNVYKTYQPEPKPLSAAEREKGAIWQANQQLVLDGRDKEAMLALVNTLQGQGFAVQNLNYYLSREASDALRDELTAEALSNIKQRADKMAAQLGLKQVRYARIDASSSNPGMPPVFARAMMAKGAEMAADAAPVVQAGETEVVVNVNAEVRMK